MDVCLLWVLCVVRWRSVRQADHSSRGVPPTVVRRCVWSKKPQEWGHDPRWVAGPRQKKRLNVWVSKDHNQASITRNFEVRYDRVQLYSLNGIPYGCRWWLQCRVCKNCNTEFTSNYIKMSSWLCPGRSLCPNFCTACTPHQILFRWTNQEKWDGRGM